VKNQRLFSLPKNQERSLRFMKTYQVEIKETLCMTVEIEAENEQQAEEKVRQAYRNEEYILDSEHFAGVEFTAKEKEMEERFRKRRRHEHER
jgi:NhaP-type Na+/H+ and K+/H+ antiporter